MAQYIAYGKELWFLVFNDTTVRRDIHLAVRKGIKRIESLVGRNTWRKMHENFNFRGSIVFHLTCFYLSLLNSLENGVDKRGCCFAIRYLAYDESLVVEFFYLCPN